MPIELTIPRIGWSMDEGIFGGWSKQSGEYVAAGEPIFELESEKATQEVESVDSGVLHIMPDAPQKGDVVEVGRLVGYLLSEGEDAPERRPAVTSLTDSHDTCASHVPAPSSKRHRHRANPRISPRAVRAAQRMNIVWTEIEGSGRDGRIRERDVMAAASASNVLGGRFVPATGVRRLIAKRLSQSLETTVPVTLTTVVRMDSVVSDRVERKSAGEVVPAFHDYFMMAVAKSLKTFSTFNTRWVNGDIFQPRGIHIGLAVETETGLKVVVVRDADQKSLLQLTEDSAKLVASARKRKLTIQESTGGTFTISNLGSFGIDVFTPIINVGESATLGLGAVRQSPQRGTDGSVVWSDQMTLSLTFDHQVADGSDAARFLQHLCSHLENSRMSAD